MVSRGVTGVTLSSRLSGALHAVGAKADAGALADELLAAWAEPHRVYHGTDHLTACLRELDAAPTGRSDPAIVELALWFHDAVYDPRASDNEERSAQWARAALGDAGAPGPVQDEVARLVMLTRHDSAPGDPSGALVCDIDLSVLGWPEHEYDDFERRIRAEYAWVPEPIYRAERARLLARFLSRGSVYRTAWFRDRYEAAARRNLERAVRRLSTA
jgi:predicted metal-dependent HD superfamily phosphohydrolase